MSKKISICCDLCGTEIPNFATKEQSAQIRLCAPGDYRGSGGQRIDLCLPCYEKFINFIESGGDRE
jgi:hypothetical protein